MSAGLVDGRLVAAAVALREGVPADAGLVADLLEAIAPLAPYWAQPYAAPFVPVIQAAVRVAEQVGLPPSDADGVRS